MASTDILSAVAVRILNVTHSAPGELSAEYKFYDPGKYAPVIGLVIAIAMAAFVYTVVESRVGVENNRVAQWVFVGLGLYCLFNLALMVHGFIEARVRARLNVRDGTCQIVVRHRGKEAGKEWPFAPEKTQIRLWNEGHAACRLFVVGIVFSELPWRIRLLRSTDRDECIALAERLNRDLKVPVLSTVDD